MYSDIYLFFFLILQLENRAMGALQRGILREYVSSLVTNEKIRRQVDYFLLRALVVTHSSRFTYNQEIIQVVLQLMLDKKEDIHVTAGLLVVVVNVLCEFKTC
jgi:hypothetical protein